MSFSEELIKELLFFLLLDFFPALCASTLSQGDGVLLPSLLLCFVCVYSLSLKLGQETQFYKQRIILLRIHNVMLSIKFCYCAFTMTHSQCNVVNQILLLRIHNDAFTM